MEPTPDDPVAAVLQTPELLDKIISFLDFETLLKARELCGQWRSLSETSLRRRFHISEAQVEEDRVTRIFLAPRRDDQHLKEFNLEIREMEPVNPVPCPTDSPTPPRPLPATLTSVLCHIGASKDDGDARRSTFVLPTLLAYEWSRKITSLSISSKALSIQEWNSVGSYILSRFPLLQYLCLSLSWCEDSRSEWKHVPAVDQNFKSQVVQVNIIYEFDQLQSSDYNPDSGVLSLNFMVYCPKLKDLKLQIIWHPGNSEVDNEKKNLESEKAVLICQKLTTNFTTRKSAWFITNENDRYILHGHSKPIKLSVRQELSRHLATLKPEVFRSRTNDYLDAFPPEASNNLKSLEIGMDIGDALNSGARYILSSLRRNPAFGSVSTLKFWETPHPVAMKLYRDIIAPDTGNYLVNITKLDLEHFKQTCICTNRRGPAQGGEYLIRLHDWPGVAARNSGRFWFHATKYLVNLQLLIVQTACDCYIEHLSHFNKLRHLVVFIEREYLTTIDFYHAQMSYVENIQTLTIVTTHPDPDWASRLQSFAWAFSWLGALKVVRVQVGGVNQEIARNAFKIPASKKIIICNDINDRDAITVESLDALL